MKTATILYVMQMPLINLAANVKRIGLCGLTLVRIQADFDQSKKPENAVIELLKGLAKNGKNKTRIRSN